MKHCIFHAPQDKLLNFARHIHHFMMSSVNIASVLIQTRVLDSSVSLQTPLHWAAKHGQAEVVKLLCAIPGVSINARSVSIGPEHPCTPGVFISLRRISFC